RVMIDPRKPLVPPTAAEVRPADNEVVAAVKGALRRQDDAGWQVADGMAELARRGWAQQRIARGGGGHQGTGSRYLAAEKLYAQRKKPGRRSRDATREPGGGPADPEANPDVTAGLDAAEARKQVIANFCNTYREVGRVLAEARKRVIARQCARYRGEPYTGE